MIKVLVVDDLGFMRIALRQIIEAEKDMRVVGEARNGADAVAMVRDLKPDVVTMDIEMPGMDGIDATRRIAEIPGAPPIVMVSSHTQEGAVATIRALRAGAVDFISKSSSFVQTDLGQINKELRPKLRHWAEHHRARLKAAQRAALAEPAAAEPVRRDLPVFSGAETRKAGEGMDLVVIGVSTGGPQVLPRLLAAIGTVPVPIVIAQHMPEFFTRSLADIMRQETALDIREGTAGSLLEPGSMTIAQGGRDWMVALRREGGFQLKPTLSEATVHPSVDVLFRSAAMAARRPVAIILTGMGTDGTDGAGHIRRRGLPVLVQSPETCVVGGMPSSAIEAGVASEILTIEHIAHRLVRWANSNRTETSMSESQP